MHSFPKAIALVLFSLMVFRFPLPNNITSVECLAQGHFKGFILKDISSTLLPVVAATYLRGYFRLLKIA